MTNPLSNEAGSSFASLQYIIYTVIVCDETTALIRRPCQSINDMQPQYHNVTHKTQDLKQSNFWMYIFCLPRIVPPHYCTPTLTHCHTPHCPTIQSCRSPPSLQPQRPRRKRRKRRKEGSRPLRGSSGPPRCAALAPSLVYCATPQWPEWVCASPRDSPWTANAAGSPTPPLPLRPLPWDLWWSGGEWWVREWVVGGRSEGVREWGRGRLFVDGSAAGKCAAASLRMWVTGSFGRVSEWVEIFKVSEWVSEWVSERTTTRRARTRKKKTRNVTKRGVD